MGFQITYAEYGDNTPYHVRHDIYCVENAFLPPKTSLCEVDEYDTYAQQAVIVRTGTGEPVAVVRIIPWGHGRPLPFAKFAPDIAMTRCWGEVSRIGIRQGARLTPRERRAVMCGLFKAVYWLSLDLGVSHWVCMMPVALQVRMARLGVLFESVGIPVDYHGLRAPCVGVAHRVLSYLEAEERALYNYIINR